MTTEAHPAPASLWRPEIAVLFTIALLQNLDRTIMSGLLQPIKQAFALSDAATGALSGMAFGLAYATLGLPFARIADVANRRILLIVSLALWSMLTIACGLAAGFWTFFAARLGVGIFEAAGAPALHALTADRFGERRSRAASLITVGMTIGAMIGIASGGVIADFAGWRSAFWVAGVPGILLAPLAWRYLAEPRAAASDLSVRGLFGRAMWVACRRLLAKPGFRYMLAAAIANAFWFWGTATWFITFLVRSHGMSLAEAAFGYGILSGISTLFGILLNGWLGDRLTRRDERWLGWLPGLATVGGLAFAVPVYLVQSGVAAMAFYIVSNIFYGVVTPAQFAAIYALTGTRSRAMGVAMLSFVIYIVGLAISATAVGAISDALTARHGDDSLRIALLLVTATLPIAAVCFWRSARSFATDIERD